MGFAKFWLMFGALQLMACLPVKGHSNTISMLLLDTQGNQSYSYRNFVACARAAGFSVDYRSIYDFLINPVIDRYDGVMLVIGEGFLETITSDIRAQFLKTVQQFAQQGNKIMGLLLPGASHTLCKNLVIQYNKELLTTFGVFADEAGVTVGHPVEKAISLFLESLLISDGAKGAAFGTTLMNQKSVPLPKILGPDGKHFGAVADNDAVIGALLPLKKHFSATVQSTLPLALYLKNKITGNRYFIARSSDLLFSEVQENFWKTPLHTSQRQELQEAVLQTLEELHCFCADKNLTAPCQSATLPETLTADYRQRQKIHCEQEIHDAIAKNERLQWICKQGISCAWLEPSDFFIDREKTAYPEKGTALEQGIDFIYNAGFNLLWFEFRPETMFNVHPQKKEVQREYIARVRTLAAALKEKFSREGKELPKIFVGADITTHYGTVPVHDAAQDLYGRRYSKIPSPLDYEHFWKPDLLYAFQEFCKVFKDCLPIDGIFLDLEWYHAPEQSNGYSNLMDFSDVSWNLFCLNKRHKKARSLVGQERVLYLKNKHLFDEYRKFLHHKAVELGRTLKQELQRICSDVLIAAYLPSLPDSWFYCGLLEGLGTSQEPVILATFNTDFYSHCRWFTDRSIYLLHGAPVMLSKLTEPSSFNLIAQLQEQHFFTWFNRPSRMIYKQRVGMPWEVEASSLSPDEVARGIRNSLTKGKICGS